MNFFSPNQEQAWNAALKLLTPTKAQLEHGLELLKFKVRNLFSLQSAQKRDHCREELLES